MGTVEVRHPKGDEVLHNEVPPMIEKGVATEGMVDARIPIVPQLVQTFP